MVMTIVFHGRDHSTLFSKFCNVVTTMVATTTPCGMNIIVWSPPQHPVGRILQCGQDQGRNHSTLCEAFCTMVATMVFYGRDHSMLWSQPLYSMVTTMNLFYSHWFFISQCSHDLGRNYGTLCGEICSVVTTTVFHDRNYDPNK